MTPEQIKTVKEFWENIKNVSNASPENIQSDILAYLVELEGSQNQIESMEIASALMEADLVATKKELAEAQQTISRQREFLEQIKSKAAIAGDGTYQIAHIAVTALEKRP